MKELRNICQICPDRFLSSKGHSQFDSSEIWPPLCRSFVGPWQTHPIDFPEDFLFGLYLKLGCSERSKYSKLAEQLNWAV